MGRGRQVAQVRDGMKCDKGALGDNSIGSVLVHGAMGEVTCSRDGIQR